MVSKLNPYLSGNFMQHFLFGYNQTFQNPVGEVGCERADLPSYFGKKIVFRLGLTSNSSSYLREIFKGVGRILYRYRDNSLFSLQFQGNPQYSY